jgi:tetratricopeptide (TPR) repeat protein
MLGELNRLPEQSQILQQAMALDPLNELLAINFAGNLASRGNYEEGKELLDGLVSLRPDSATLHRIISGYALKSGNLAEGWRYANQSYDLEPDSPAVIEILSNAWQSLGVDDKAEKLLLDGLEIAGDNFGLQSSYTFLLIKQGRIEKAAQLLKEQFGDSVAGLPEKMQQHYYFQKGLIAMLSGDLDTARDLMELSIQDDSEQTWNSQQMMFLTISSALQKSAGNSELAEARLSSAERAVRRARINGVDDAQIYYMESSIHALRGRPQAALESLQIAYERGFRGIWFLGIDLRLESLQQEPEFVAIKEKIERDIFQARSEVESFIVAVL